MFTKDALYYAEQIRQKKISIEELTIRTLDNIKRYNKLINAVIISQEDSALKQAKAMDKALKDNPTDLPPFYGVPILTKDLGQTEKGVPTHSGAKIMKDVIGAWDHGFTTKLKEAGFIILGRTNVPEFGFKNISDSQFEGVVNAPFDLTRNPGGSSGGAAAALVAGLVPIVTASDGGGSIRMPASFSGLIGLKPTRGRMPMGPVSFRSWQGAALNFFLTKTVEETWELLKFHQVEQWDSAFMLPLIKEEQLTPLTRPLKIAYSFNINSVDVPPTDEAKQAVEEMITALKELGHQVEEVDSPIDCQSLMESYFLMNGVETVKMLSGFDHLQKDDVEPLTWAIYQSGLKVPAYQYSQLLDLWDVEGAKMEQFHQDYDVLFMPATNGPAPKQGQFDLTPEQKEQIDLMADWPLEKQQAFVWELFTPSMKWTPYAPLLNLTGHPAISLPTHRTKDHLPLGVQFSAGRGEEYLLLQLAKQLEEAGHLDVLQVDLAKDH
ncbi:amidase [Dolosicoccus paucivorans]|uniref:amidase n=1 Tax=Dolosicoccus paucivorans TaxID=84521 RepID=UPI0008899D3D|nr:amidase [Dolosicoccus paucivorans]SDI35550.1 amidase [Dolosicoccus paucivorans]